MSHVSSTGDTVSSGEPGTWLEIIQGLGMGLGQSGSTSDYICLLTVPHNLQHLWRHELQEYLIALQTQAVPSQGLNLGLKSKCPVSSPTVLQDPCLALPQVLGLTPCAPLSFQVTPPCGSSRDAIGVTIM